MRLVYDRARRDCEHCLENPAAISVYDPVSFNGTGYGICGPCYDAGWRRRHDGSWVPRLPHVIVDPKRWPTDRERALHAARFAAEHGDFIWEPAPRGA